MSDIRKLMDSANPTDWQMALRLPDVTGTDIDYLLGRMFAHARDDSWHQQMRRPVSLPLASELVQHPAFTPEHLHNLISIRHNLKPGTYGNGEPRTRATYRESVLSMLSEHVSEDARKKFDEQAFDLMLDEPQDWFGTELDVRNVADHPNFSPGNLTRVLELARRRREFTLGRSREVTAQYIGPAFDTLPYLGKFFKQRPDIPAGWLGQWLDYGIKNQNVGTSHLVEQIALHPNLTDEHFHKLLSSEHPRRDALKHRQMTDSQLKSFLTDPRFQDPAELGNYGDAMRAQSEAIGNQERISPENADLASRHPWRAVRAAIARHPSAPRPVLERLLEHELGIEKHIVQNPGADADLLHKTTQKLLTTGLNEGYNVHDSLGVIESVIDHPKTPPATIDAFIDPEGKLYGSRHPLLWGSVRAKVAKDAMSLTPEQQLELASDSTHQVAQALVQRDDITPEAVRVAFSTPRKGLHRIITRNSILMRHPDVLTSQHLKDWLEQEGGDLLNYSRDALQNGLAHRNMPPHMLDPFLVNEYNEDYRIIAAQSPHVHGEKLLETLHSPTNTSNDWANVVRNSPNMTEDIIASLALSHHNPVIRGAALAHKLATPELLRSIPYQEEPFEVVTGILGNPNTPGDLVDKIALDPLAGSARLHALEHHAISDAALERLIAPDMQEFDPTMSQEALKVHRLRHPDVDYAPENRARVKFGVSKLRRIRDMIWEHDPVKGEAPPNKLPPGDWSAGRVASGNISAKKLQEVIDAAPEVQYNMSRAEWTGAQRHSDEPSYVTQVNLTDDHVKKMKAAGVYNTFLSMMRASEESGHPIRPGHTLGWVRWTGLGLPPALGRASMSPNLGGAVDRLQAKAGIHVDEIQSDFGQDWIRLSREQAENAGMDGDEAERRAAVEWPAAHQKTISNILFGGRHPNEAIGEAFMQHLRNEGFHNTPIHIHDASTKAPLSGMKEGVKLPGHMQFTYRDLPKKLGMKPDKYGKLPTQSNPELKDKATWSDKVRKAEEWLFERGEGGDVQAQSGLSGAVERRLVAVQGSGQSRPDPATLREALVKYEDVDQAVIAVTGIDPQLFASITSLTKAEPEPTPERAPTVIEPLTRSAGEVADAVRRAFHLGRVKSVYLGGKHSAGSMLATDPQEHTVWYLKPGSGGQSPAAGVQEEIASQARREAGFWHIACAWGLEHFLPRAEVITMDGHDWAALRFLDKSWKNFDDMRKERPSEAVQALERLRRYGILHRWAVLDWVCGNTDRHAANLMMGPTGFVKLIDHGAAFAGPSFNPGHDPKSFVPFYLRYRSPQQWATIPVEEKLSQMAAINPAQDMELRRWVQNLDADQLVAILRKDGLNADPSVARLRQVQHLAATVQPGQLYAAINRLWAGV